MLSIGRVKVRIRAIAGLILGIATVLFSSAASAQKLEEVLGVLDEAERLFQQYRLEWTLQEVMTSAPRSEQSLQRLRSGMQRAMQKQRLPEAIIEKETSEALRREAQGTQLSGGGKWIAEWGRGLLHVQGARTLGEATGTFVFHAYYGKDYLVEYADPEYNKYAAQKGARVFCFGGESYRYHSPDQGALDLLPAELCLLAGLNPLRIANTPNWRLVKQESNVVTYEKPVEGAISRYLLRLELDAQRGYAIKRFWCIAIPDSHNWSVEATVRGYRAWGKVWVPSEVVVEGVYLGGQQRRRREWRLTGITSTREINLRIPEGLPVMDYRLAGCDLLSTQQMFSATESGSAVSYRSSGRLPSVAELQRQAVQHTTGANGAHKGSSHWRLIPPLLLIAIGILWYWRLKRLEGKR
ncbi:MAG: hypothetical protein KatS3mg022_1567 [Armatimonadota bacterium]|nr:MAG: hypothetical protein KatS3mg022_1567 [Armatimonadota bacterium]